MKGKTVAESNTLNPQDLNDLLSSVDGKMTLFDLGVDVFSQLRILNQIEENKGVLLPLIEKKFARNEQGRLFVKEITSQKVIAPDQILNLENGIRLKTVENLRKVIKMAT